MAEVLQLDPTAPDSATIERAAAVLRRGGLVAFPTETVYGLGANALDRHAVRRIFEAKGRPSNDPLIVHVHDVAQLNQLAEQIPHVAGALAARFWPGPLTMVLRRSAKIPVEVTAGLETVAIRMPAHPVARALIEAAGCPVAAPSANMFSRPSPTRAQHVLDDLGDRVDLILDAGATALGVESTVVDLTATIPTILRPGVITLDMLRNVLPNAQLRAIDPAGSERLKSPGLLSRHYSPRTPLRLYQGPSASAIRRIGDEAVAAVAAGQRVGIIAADEDQLPQDERLLVVRIGRADDLETIASNLYAALRVLDASDVDVIFVRDFPPDPGGLGLAIHDRLSRAASVIIPS